MKYETNQYFTKQYEQQTSDHSSSTYTVEPMGNLIDRSDILRFLYLPFSTADKLISAKCFNDKTNLSNEK